MVIRNYFLPLLAFLINTNINTMIDEDLDPNYFPNEPEVSYQNYKNEIEWRIALNENLNTPYNDDDKKPLIHRMIYMGYDDLVTLLIKNNANPNIEDGTTNVPLHKSVFLSNLPITKLLLEHNACANHQDVIEDTPLLVSISAKDKNKIPILKLLLHHNANPNIKNILGVSPLIDIAQNQNFFSSLEKDREIFAKLFIQFGADINQLGIDLNIQNFELAQTAGMIARKNGLDALANFIEDYADHRDNLIDNVKKNQSIIYKKINLGLCHVKSTDGNNLAYHALQNKNWNVLNKVLYLDATILKKPNFKNETPYDLMEQDSSIIVWLLNYLSLE